MAEKTGREDSMADINIRKTIAQKGCALGTFLSISTVPAVEALSFSGLDFVIIDTEHGPYDTETMADLVSAAAKGGMAPIVRVADVTHREIQRAADAGARGIIVPCLRTVDEFRKAAELAKFPPIGNRGFIKARGSGFGQEPWASGSLREYMDASNERLLLLPQCETKEALENIEEIAAIPGIDGIFIGPFDLSIAMGIPGEFGAPEFLEAVERIKRACRKAGKLCTTFAGNASDAKREMESGMDAVAVSMDSAVFSEAYSSLVKQIRG
ncbi:MAG: host specificity protein [Clostridia bacterium]|nr:host specificity protein [Clostridia bacterium]